MSSQFYRKYIDIINENSQPEILTEGMIQDIINKIKQKFSSIPDNLKKQTANLVSGALGKPLDQISMADLTLANANKVAAANAKLSEGNYQRGDTPTWMIDRRHGEVEEIPGSFAKDQRRQTSMGGILGAIAGYASIAMIGGGAALETLPASITAGLMAIVVALMFRSAAEAEYGAAGYDDPASRDPRLPARADRPAAMQVGQYPTQKPIYVK